MTGTRVILEIKIMCHFNTNMVHKYIVDPVHLIKRRALNMQGIGKRRRPREQQAFLILILIFGIVSEL